MGIVVAFLFAVCAADNGLARTPPMGWMSWEIFRCQIDCANHPDACINEKLYKTMTDHIVSDGYLAAGYKTVSIDDCWENKTPERDSQGRLAPNPQRFPSGMKALGDYMHGKGVNFGIYSDEGTKTCGGYPGSKGYEAVDAKTFADWGVDYLKLDGCYNNGPGFATGYPAMGKGLNESGRAIVYSCSWPAYLGANETAKPFDKMIAAGCNLWRNWADIQNGWSSLSKIIDHWGDYSKILQQWAGPGHWHDPDMLLIGDSGATEGEARIQMGIWSIVAAPLIMGNDLRTVQPQFKAILLNKEVIAVDQDSLGKMGGRISPLGDTEVWARELSGGDMAVALLNKGTGPAKITATFHDIGFGASANIRDLFTAKDLGKFTASFSSTVPSHDIMMLKLTKA
eukprot:NODE_162_length_1323_cov_114.195447_g129_i0.p1 GENE.NODE_162_length_1323_cov_114.195447_g129_i0~~NODE_162_length_1323_cov_114.195447_g129_i0.p1  ORF type:complete len:406 (+),score=114.91 NODE_162_length_1323_cov_114.195447_g129_i0:29-1219(+)